jgi:succinate dehydrogenase / fumarate reductase iron-sulfur subunit
MVENPDFIGPAALAKAFRFVSDPREGNKTHRLKALSEKNGIWDCTRCGMCLDACPKGVDPMEAIVKLRTRAIQNPNVPANAGERHARVFKKDIATWGILNEPFMLLKTLHVGVLGQLGNALNLAKKGKIPNPFPVDHKVEGLDEVQKIYDILQQNPIDVETKAEDTGPGAG